MLGCAWDVTVGVWGLIWALICSYDPGPLSRPIGTVRTWFKYARTGYHYYEKLISVDSTKTPICAKRPDV